MDDYGGGVVGGAGNGVGDGVGDGVGEGAGDDRGGCALTGVVFDVKRFAIHDGPGIRTTVFLKGCPLDCPWCHNPESRHGDPELSFRSSRCIGCGQCAAACTRDAIEMARTGHAADGAPSVYAVAPGGQDAGSDVGPSGPIGPSGTIGTNVPIGPSGASVPVTSVALCELCGDCVEACPSGAREMVGRAMSVDAVVEVASRDRVFYEQSGGGVTFSGGEPLAQPAFLVEALRRCQSAGLHTAVDTTLHAPTEVVDAVAGHADVFLADIKLVDSAAHEDHTSTGNELVVANLRRLAARGVPIIVRVPLVAGVNDDHANIEATGRLAASLRTVERVDLLPYIEGGPVKARRLVASPLVETHERPSDRRIAAAVAQLERHGLTVSVGG